MTRQEHIASLKAELDNLIAPRVTSEDCEDVSDRYQEALEVGWERSDLEDKIMLFEGMSDKAYVILCV
jgi:hypothetical protein